MGDPTSQLAERLQALPGTAPAWSFDVAGFDGRDPLQVDEVAGHLLERFFGRDDPEAFRLLVDVATPLLHEVAIALVEELGLAVDPVLLVSRHMASIFTDLRPRRPTGERFLAEAERAMRALARGQLDAARGGPPAPLVRVPAPLATGHAAGDADVARLTALGASYLALVQASFHALNETDRKLLLAAEVRDLSYNQIAEKLSIPASQIGPMLRDARERFARHVAVAFQRAGPGEGDRR